MFKNFICQNKNWVFQNFPFLENDFDALTDYELFCKMVEYAKSLAITNEKFISELKNDLDTMYNEGKFDSLIEEIINLQVTFTFNNVSDMQLATNLVNNSFVKTMGFYNIGDGGQAYYKVREKTLSDIVDDITIISLSSNDIVAELIKPSVIKPEIFGSYGDGVHDDSDAISYMLNYVYNLESSNTTWEKTLPMICENTYKISEIVIPSGMQQIEIDGHNKGTFIDGGFTFNEGSGWHTYIKNLNFDECENPLNFEYYNIEYGKIIIENCKFDLCTGTTLNIERRSHQVFISKNRFSNCEKIAYVHDVDMCYFEENWIEDSLTWEDNQTMIEQYAEYEGTIFIKNNLFIPGASQTGNNLSWIKVGRNATIEGNRFSGENDGIHPVKIDYDEFNTFVTDKFMYPIINFINNPIVAGSGSLLMNAFCGQLNIHNNSFVKSHPCIEVINSTTFNNLDFNKLYISIKDNTGKLFNYRNKGYSLINGEPIVPKCLQKFIKKGELFSLNSNLNYEGNVSGKTLSINLNTNNLDLANSIQFLINANFHYNPESSPLYFDNILFVLGIKREYNIDIAGIVLKPYIHVIGDYDSDNITLTPKINGENYITSTDSVLNDGLTLSVIYGALSETAYITYKGIKPLELIPVVNTNDDNDWNLNN